MRMRAVLRAGRRFFCQGQGGGRARPRLPQLADTPPSRPRAARSYDTRPVSGRRTSPSSLLMRIAPKNTEASVRAFIDVMQAGNREGCEAKGALCRSPASHTSGATGIGRLFAFVVLAQGFSRPRSSCPSRFSERKRREEEGAKYTQSYVLARPKGTGYTTEDRVANDDVERDWAAPLAGRGSID